MLVSGRMRPEGARRVPGAGRIGAMLEPGSVRQGGI